MEHDSNPYYLKTEEEQEKFNQFRQEFYPNIPHDQFILLDKFILGYAKDIGIDIESLVNQTPNDSKSVQINRYCDFLKEVRCLFDRFSKDNLTKKNST